MNEWERRALEVAQQRNDIAELVSSLGGNLTVEHFGYTVQIGSSASPLLDGVTQSKLLAMQSDAWFVLQYLTCCVIKPSTPWYFSDAGNIKLQISDTGAGYTLFSQPNSAGVVTATISRPQTGTPLLLPVPRFIPPNTNIKIDATQMGATIVTNEEPIGFWISLMGSRIAMV